MALSVLSIVYNYLDYMHILQQLCGDGPVPRDDGRTMAVADALMTVNVLNALDYIQYELQRRGLPPVSATDYEELRAPAMRTLVPNWAAHETSIFKSYETEEHATRVCDRSDPDTATSDRAHAAHFLEGMNRADPATFFAAPGPSAAVYGGGPTSEIRSRSRKMVRFAARLFQVLIMARAESEEAEFCEVEVGDFEMLLVSIGRVMELREGRYVA